MVRKRPPNAAVAVVERVDIVEPDVRDGGADLDYHRLINIEEIDFNVLFGCADCNCPVIHPSVIGSSIVTNPNPYPIRRSEAALTPTPIPLHRTATQRHRTSDKSQTV